MAKKPEPFKVIPTSYDIEANPNADGFDPIAWYEGTGEDLGLPADYFRGDDELEAELRKKIAAERAADPSHGWPTDAEPNVMWPGG